jgi:hypothetical protein
MIAAMQSTGITFMGIDGLRSVTLRWPTQPFLGGMAWMDNETVALLGRDWRHHTVTLVKSDGTVLRSIDLPGVPSDEDTPTDELAVSPDGKVMVIVTPEETFFLDAAGKVVGSAKHKKRTLAHPTFTPDGKEVAFKYMDVDDLVVGRTEAIVFFSPDGKEQRRIAIPALKVGTTRPVTVPTASAPTTRPTEH